ncbi:hypothetical protein KCU93_g8524, partial [Aureobasidium melanogenum]
MASRSVLPENPEPLLGLSGSRKRTLVDEDTNAEDQANKRQHTTPDIRDDDDISLDSDVESLFNETDDTEDTEMVDKEPEQGPVLWSADQEEYPPCAIYHEDVKKHQARITELAVNVGVHSAKISSNGSDMAKLHAEAIAIQKFPEPKKVIIALMGDAGSGKSSLINSILDIPHIAKEGNYGSACTCAPTEYMSAFPEQTKKFAAKVEFLNAAQRCKLLKDHLRDYAFFNFEEDRDWTFEETKEYRAQAQTAEDTFLDLFRGKPSFKNREELESHIRTVHESGTEATFVAQLEVWCNELIAAHASSLHMGMIETDQAFRLRRALGPVLSSGNSSNDEPRLWPLVLKVSIGIQGCRLLENLIIVDMPGVSDISRVRVRASKNYLRNCDFLWIIAPVQRCISDTGVDSILFEYGERFAGRLALICTKIDDRMSCEAFKDEYPQAAKQMEKFEKALKEAKTNYFKAKAQLGRVTKPSTLEELNAEVERCRERYQKVVDARLRFMVLKRNQKVAQQIYEKKSEYFVRCENGPVFFVSNEHYMWLKGFKDSATEDVSAQLSAEMTGIPALRAYALSIPAKDLWSTLMAHIQHAGVTSMRSLAIWAARTGADNGDKLKTIKENSTKATIKNEALKLLAVTMRVALAEVAQKGYDYLHNEVRGWFWSTIRAFIEREGTYASKAVGFMDWNSKLRRPAVRHLGPGWTELFVKERAHMTTAETKFKGNLDVLQHDLKEIMSLDNIPVEQFGGLITAQKHGIARATEKCRDNMDKELSDDGYFAQAMRPTYREAAQVRGKISRTGYKNNVMTMLEDQVNNRTHDSPFIRMVDYATNKVDQHARTFSEDLHKECHNIYNEVFNQFGGLVTEAEDDNKDVVTVKAALRDYLPYVVDEMADIIRRLKEIEKNPRPKTTTPKSGKIKKEEKQQKSKVKPEVKHEQL